MTNPFFISRIRDVKPGRKLGRRFQTAEAAWIISGDDRVKTIAPYSKAISNFSDDGVKFFGSYALLQRLWDVANKKPVSHRFLHEFNLEEKK